MVRSEAVHAPEPVSGMGHAPTLTSRGSEVLRVNAVLQHVGAEAYDDPSVRPLLRSRAVIALPEEGLPTGTTLRAIMPTAAP